LLLYPSPVWEPIRARALKLSDLDKVKAGWKRLLVGMADEVSPDGQGRILIAPWLREHARLEKQLMMVGQGKHFEIWGEAAWKRQLDDIRSAVEQGTEGSQEDFTL
jgi:MraZ protein